MVRVMASGVFDLIHPGHIDYLKQAKSYGDHLTVVIASDKTVRKNKHEPVTPEAMRALIVESLKPVDEAIVGGEGDMLDTVAKVKPDIIVLGYDQNFDESELKAKLKERGFDGIDVVRANECADDLNATRRIMAKIREMGSQ
ncbi:MAG: adenylyltransferase/cytidyltransferase family protein [Candidatus Methanomethylophilaceae archaeon]|jgi:FAD synthetase|nr:adenylyltransferase/cytidyltransferase family protein [Candidatus Methanomethylophilaceae archaeon]